MLPLTSTIKPTEMGPSSEEKWCISWDAPFSKTAKSFFCKPRTGWPVLSVTVTGTRVRLTLTWMALTRASALGATLTWTLSMSAEEIAGKQEWVVCAKAGATRSNASPARKGEREDRIADLRKTLNKLQPHVASWPGMVAQFGAWE
jgi:hypothetical protein